MATCSFKTKLALSLTAAFSFFAMVFSLGGITLAAYLNAIEAEYSNRMDFSDLGDYFNSITKDADTGKTIYQISTEDQLRNLQMLVSLGLFDENDIFKLDSNILWDGVPMAPIGSDDMPFNSTFNGCGHTITGLQIACYDGRDAGLFGYTSITSEVKNLVLISPTINVTANSDGTTEISGSPVEAVLSSAAADMPDIVFSENGQAVDGSITIINDSESSQSKIVGFPGTIKDINENSYEVIYESSDDSLIQAQDDGSFLTYKTETAAPNYDLFACTITAKVGYLIDDRFGYYVLERYQFNVLGNGFVTTTTDQDGNHMGAFKTIHPSNNEHKTYAGFFIGHCDGKANHLALIGDNQQSNYNAKLVINANSRKYIYSSRVLIGMTRSDNPIDASAGEAMSITYDFDSPITEANVTTNPTNDMLVKDIESGYANSSYAYGSHYTEDPYNTGNDQDVARQWENAEVLTEPYIPNATIRGYSKIFPGSKPSATNGANGTKKVTTSFANVKLEGSDEATNKDSFFGLVFDGGLGAGTMTQVVETGRQLMNRYRRFVRGIYVNNGIWLWSTKNFSPLFGENLFYINIRISYVATRTEGTPMGQNSFQILANAYDPEVIAGEGENLVGSYAQNLFWQDLYSPYSYNLTRQNSMYNPADYPIEDDGKLHSALITLQVDQDNNNFLGSFVQGILGDENSEKRYPVLAIGMGSNQNPNSITGSTMKYYADVYENGNLAGNSHFLTYENNKFGGSNDEDIGNYLIGASLAGAGVITYGYQTFEREDDKYVWLPILGTILDLSDRYESHERAYFNSYFEVANGTKLYIKDLQITFTNRQGNTEDIVYDVDYVHYNDVPTFENHVYTYWPDSSNVMIGFDIDGSQGNGAVSFSFYRNGSGTVFGNSDNTNAGYALTNSGGTGYTDATLTQG